MLKMKFEEIIRTISSWVAGVAVFLIAAGIYLSAKGFVMGPDGVPVLVKNAQAEDNTVEINKNAALPQGKILGNPKAPVAIYEFSSYGCFHCADFHLQVLPEIKKNFIDKGWVRLVFIPFPLEAKSMQAAMIAECVNDKQYFAFVDLLFKKQREWGLSRKSDKIISQYAALSGLNTQKAEACLHDDAKAEEILSRRQQAMENFKIQGTPAFLVVGNKQREMLYGAPSYEDMASILNRYLGREEKK